MDCYIFGAAPVGEIPDIPQGNEAGLIIAADAGLITLKGMNLSPDIVLGDFDSLGEIPQVRCEIITHPVEKDDTDMALAADLAVNRGCDRIFMLGGMGGERMDHTIANLQTLSSLAKRGITAFLTDGKSAFTAISSGSRLTFPPGYKGDLSVFCASGYASGVSIRNLYYTLENATLSSDTPLGVSNSFLTEQLAKERGAFSEPPEISVETGTLWVYFNCENKPFSNYPSIN
ncbi:MAG: thiamine diphosphokinase [Clostridia bacterium]|nr:thiamine diphosphokinase [Clostridia bacterium]